MSDLHGSGVLAVLAAAIGYALVGGFVAASGRAPRWASVAWLAVLAILVLQGAGGVAVAVTSGGPAEMIHWVYGPAAVLLLLAGNGIALGLPARQRGGVMVATAVVLVLVAWRLVETG